VNEVVVVVMVLAVELEVGGSLDSSWFAYELDPTIAIDLKQRERERCKRKESDQRNEDFQSNPIQSNLN